eukprot:6424552-Prymnesium_polylepis.2
MGGLRGIASVCAASVREVCASVRASVRGTRPPPPHACARTAAGGRQVQAGQPRVQAAVRPGEAAALQRPDHARVGDCRGGLRAGECGPAESRPAAGWLWPRTKSGGL